MKRLSLSVAVLTLALSGSLAVAAPAAKKAEAGPSDPQIAAIVVTANSVDIEAGQLAKATSTNLEVTKFAELMITDHSAVNKSATELVGKLNVTPEDSDASRGLKDGGAKNLEALKALKGAAFDKAYVNHEVDYHVAVLDTIDRVLIPNAKNAELKALIVKVRPAIATHLEHARMLQKTLAK